jgi:hypothetical protein
MKRLVDLCTQECNRVGAQEGSMRKRIYNWQGQRFGYIWIQGEPGESLEKQSQGLFDRAGPELASLGLGLDKNVVRTRVYGRTREARNIVSAARGRAFYGQARAATSSFISPDHLDWYSNVALELWAMATPTEGAPRKVTEMEPVAVFIRHLVWGPLVFHAGMTNNEFPTLQQQCAEILPRAGARLKENGCDWHNVCASHSCFTIARSRSRCSTLPQRSCRCRSKMPRSSWSTAIQRRASSSRSK